MACALEPACHGPCSRLATVSPLQRKPGREADVNCQEMGTDDNWVVIQPKYLFHGFFCATRIRFSVCVKKKRGTEREGKASEEKTKEVEWGGGAGVCSRKFESPTIAESSLSSYSHVCFADVAISWHFAAVLGTAWAKRTPPHFSEPQASESFLLSPPPPPPPNPAACSPWVAHTLLPPQLGTTLQSQMGPSQPGPMGGCFLIFIF